jgi:multiple sugar transport system substrate-binding protein
MEARGTPVKIEVMELPAPDDPYREALVTRLAAGAGPDVFALDTFHVPADSAAGYLLDITDRVEAWEWDRWIPAAKDAVTFDGKVWGLNMDTDVRPVYYRKDIFEQAGLPVTWQPTSWDDILAAARTIKEKVPGVYPVAFKAGVLGGEATTMQGFYMLLLGAGGRLYDAEIGKWIAKSSALLDVLDFYHTIYIEEKLSTEPEFWLAGAPVDKIHLFLRDGKLAILPTWDGVWYDSANPAHERYIGPPEVRDEVLGYCMMPAKEPGAGIRGQDFVTISGGWSIAINAACEHPDIAWEFLKFLHTKGEIFSLKLDVPVAVSLPARWDMAECPGWLSISDDYAIWRSMELVPLTTFRPGLFEYPKISDAVQEATEKILLGESPEAVLDWYAQEVTRIVGADKVVELP